MEPSAIRDALVLLVDLPGLRVPDKRLLREALDLYSSEALGFIDAYNGAMMRRRGLDRIYSYDNDFDKAPGIKRVEP